MSGHGFQVLSVAVSLVVAVPALAQSTLILPAPGDGYIVVPPVRRNRRGPAILAGIKRLIDAAKIAARASWRWWGRPGWRRKLITSAAGASFCVDIAIV
jgi:hypothetical protein